jgi:serine/threonine protein kinase
MSSEAIAGWSKPVQDAAFDLLTRCLEYSPSKRISAAQALRHEFFAQIGAAPGSSSSASAAAAKGAGAGWGAGSGAGSGGKV